VHVPVGLAFVLALIFQFLTWVTGAPVTLHRGSVKDGTRSYCADNERAIRVLGYRPIVGMSEGVRRSCEGYERLLAERAKAKGKMRQMQKDTPTPNIRSKGGTVWSE
jgi:sterol-4alpha-carboxylate 3-dehydrogenase (decarboxylating)